MTRLESLCVALCAALLSGCVASQPTIRVGTYNIRLTNRNIEKTDGPNAWPQRREAVVGLIRKMKLDAFGLQEVTPEQAAYLREHLPEFAFVGDHRGADRISDEASPVFYRKSRLQAERAGTFWLSETPDVPGTKGWKAACPRVCSYMILRDRETGRRFCFANTHADHRSAEAREKGMLLIVKRMKEFGCGCPIVFVGDHNCRETEGAARAVARRLQNALYLSETPPVGSWRTWNGWRWRDYEIRVTEALTIPIERRNENRPHPDLTGATRGKDELLDDTFYERCGGPRLDYIYVSQGVRVFDYVTVNDSREGARLYPSDHFPVVATLGL